ncbi:TonB protein C-terminal [Methylobacillus rhizosphaerae]|uniref:TonB protein C-terminal n=1 Tax=Methylobacillus rhizosphaerae TaxID=551994 RepID=A0A238YSR4_9PROT|nr:energy transducer TonB [Methylobacillus rhizosphaerae]SNR74316.1 TonB protein C-terminal [Methylobacillus rhizosphaerae]
MNHAFHIKHHPGQQKKPRVDVRKLLQLSAWLWLMLLLADNLHAEPLATDTCQNSFQLKRLDDKVTLYLNIEQICAGFHQLISQQLAPLLSEHDQPNISRIILDYRNPHIATDRYGISALFALLLRPYYILGTYQTGKNTRVYTNRLADYVTPDSAGDNPDLKDLYQKLADASVAVLISDQTAQTGIKHALLLQLFRDAELYVEGDGDYPADQTHTSLQDSVHSVSPQLKKIKYPLPGTACYQPIARELNKVISQAHAASLVYPATARARQQSGTGYVMFFVNEQLEVSDPIIAQSTGSSRLDLAMLNSIDNMQLTPYADTLHIPADCHFRVAPIIPVTFAPNKEENQEQP